jgi:transposase
VEAVPWARFWARVTTTLGRAVAELAQHLSWQETARHFRLDWKSVASIVRRVVAYGLERRRRRPLHLLGIDEVSRRKGHH